MDLSGLYLESGTTAFSSNWPLLTTHPRIRLGTSRKTHPCMETYILIVWIWSDKTGYSSVLRSPWPGTCSSLVCMTSLNIIRESDIVWSDHFVVLLPHMNTPQQVMFPKTVQSHLENYNIDGWISAGFWIDRYLVERFDVLEVEPKTQMHQWSSSSSFQLSEGFSQTYSTQHCCCCCLLLVPDGYWSLALSELCLSV